MLQRFIVIAVMVGAVYWYWSGPYQEKRHPPYSAILEQNDATMAQCIRGATYKLGATGSGVDASQATLQCAENYNLYESDGHWHSYDLARPD